MTSIKSARFPQTSQGRRNREYSPSKGVMYSPYVIEEDQKDIIIQKLKEEICLLEKNGDELSTLKDHYRKLEHQYNLLQNDKKANDNTFAKHHESALKEICLMKNEIDNHKIEFRDKKLELEDLTADENTLHNELDQKQIEVEKLKNDLRSSIADNEELGAEKEKLIEIHRTVSQERQRRADDCQKMKMEIDKVEQKIEELTKYHATLQKEEKALTEEIVKFEEQNNKADEEIAASTEDIATMNDKINESQSKIGDLQRKTAEVTGISEKFKNDSQFAKKSCQSEAMRNNGLSKDIMEAESILGVRINQVKEGHRELDLLNDENSELEKINGQLEDDLEACRRHLENLSLLNNDLVCHMQTISEEDEEVRALVDRRERVQRAEMRVKEREEDRRLLMKKNEDSTASSSRFNSYSRRAYNY